MIKQRNGPHTVILASVLGSLFSLLVFATLISGQSAVGAAGERFPTLERYASGTISPRYTKVLTSYIYLPILEKPCPYESSRSPLKGKATHSGKIEFLLPADCTMGIPAESSLLVGGTYTGTAPGQVIWVLAYAPNLLYYPQSPNACEGEPPYQEDGSWQTPAYLGLKGGDPEWFDIVVIVTNKETSDFLSLNLKQNCRKEEFPGYTAVQLEQLSLTEKIAIRVQTTD